MDDDDDEDEDYKDDNVGWEGRSGDFRDADGGEDVEAGEKDKHICWL